MCPLFCTSWLADWALLVSPLLNSYGFLLDTMLDSHNSEWFRFQVIYLNLDTLI